jgi:hypothetical protein
MALRMVGVHGYEVEVIDLDGRPRFRISQRVGGRRYLVAYVRTVAEVAGHLDLTDLAEVVELKEVRPPAGA